MDKKQTIRLNESQLKRVVAKFVKKILNEDYCWWGDTKPLEEIYKNATQIVDSYSKMEDSYFEDEESRASLDLYKWAQKVADEAEQFIHCEAHNTSINGGENW